MEYTELKRELCKKVQERMDYLKDLSDREVEDAIDLGAGICPGSQSTSGRRKSRNVSCGTQETSEKGAV